jgi:hypothetical protein
MRNDPTLPASDKMLPSPKNTMMVVSFGGVLARRLVAGLIPANSNQAPSA